MRKRNHTVTIRMNEKEYALLQQKIKASGQTQQAVILCKFTLSKGNEGKDDLKQFIDQIEAGLFHNEIASSQLDVLEAKTLCVFLMNLSDIRYPDEYKRYLKKYGHLCQKYEYTGEPYISMRMAWNMRGGYYLNIGDYIRAESAFVNALKVRVVDEDKCVISRPQLQSNLLLVYYVQNDLEKAYPLAAELIDAIENDESGKYIKDADIYRIYTMLIAMETQAMADPDPEQISEIKNLLDETCESILADDSLEAPREKSIFFIICIFYLLQQERCSISEQAHYLYALQSIEKQNDLFNLAPMQKTMLYYCQALVSWNIEDTNATEYFKKFMRRQELGNYMSLAIEIIFILSGQARNCIEKEIQEKNSMEY